MNGILSLKIQQSKNNTVTDLSVLQNKLFMNLKAQLLDLVNQCLTFMRCLLLMEMLINFLVTEALEFLAKKKLEIMLTVIEIKTPTIKISSKPRVLD